MTTPTFVALTQTGLDLANTLKTALPGSETHGFAGRTEGADVTFSDAAEHFRRLFAEGRPIIAVCAAGIVIRALSGRLADKTDEPPVLVVAEDGSAVVPLLGGHGGANRMASVLAEACGGVAAITTTGDLRLGVALDDPPPGWSVANRSAAKHVAAALLAGQPVALHVEAGDAGWLSESDIEFSEVAPLAVRVTDKIADENTDDLILHPPVLAVGVGCERNASPEEVQALVAATLAEAGLAADAVACVVSIDVKADEAAVHAVAESLGVPARFFTAVELEKEAPRLANPSDVVFAEVGCHGVAEGAALAAVGTDGVLTVTKRKSARATCAIATAPGTIDPAAVGRKRGSLTVVGIGPGSAEWRTPAVTRALAAADEVVGYGLYLDLVADVIAGKPRRDSALSEEEARVRHALERAATGLDVALVSSGDPGIYALATLAFELLDRENRDDWNRLAIAVQPGVSALQAAASRIGAPIGHDFCTISLSDLLTPWSEIEKRLQAAAEGDFVVALYNPVSKRRRHQLQRAQEILSNHRPAETPVVLARNLGREGESINVIPLSELTPDSADMLTLVLIGNSQTRKIERGQNCWVYTPRGYESKLSAVSNQ